MKTNHATCLPAGWNWLELMPVSEILKIVEGKEMSLTLVFSDRRKGGTMIVNLASNQAYMIIHDHT